MNRSEVIWLSRGGVGRVRRLSVSPFLVKVLLTVVLLALGAMPFLEKKIISLQTTVFDLEQESAALRAEVMSLLHVRKALAGMDEKEELLRNHFGLENYESLEGVVGLGGESPPSFQRRSSAPAGSYPHARVAHKVKDLASAHEMLGWLKGRQGEAWRDTPSIAPVDMKRPRISSGFGLRTNPFTNKVEFHAGVDLVGPKGTGIIAPAAGEVIGKGYDAWLGNHVLIRHSDDMSTIYGHLEEVSVDVGVKVKRGALLGTMGNTGLSTSPHLHYAVLVRDRAVDPQQFILDMRPKG